VVGTRSSSGVAASKVLAEPILMSFDIVEGLLCPMIWDHVIATHDVHYAENTLRRTKIVGHY
jgi:hypothetical protein